jgi:hypothetical protein
LFREARQFRFNLTLYAFFALTNLFMLAIFLQLRGEDFEVLRKLCQLPLYQLTRLPPFLLWSSLFVLSLILRNRINNKNLRQAKMLKKLEPKSPNMSAAGLLNQSQQSVLSVVPDPSFENRFAKQQREKQQRTLRTLFQVIAIMLLQILCTTAQDLVEFFNFQQTQHCHFEDPALFWVTWFISRFN